MIAKDAKIYVAGHHGLVGSAIWNNLQARGYHNLVGRTHKELDLLDGVAVRRFFDEEQPNMWCLPQLMWAELWLTCNIGQISFIRISRFSRT